MPAAFGLGFGDGGGSRSSDRSGLPEVRAGETGGLHVLIVSLFEAETTTSSSGSKASRAHAEMVASLVGPNARIVRRRADDLADYILSFEYDILVESSKVIAKRFDKLDLIYISGDMKESNLPWSPKASQLVTFLRMCQVTRKAVFCSGGAAFHAIFSLATQGRQYHVLNAPNGEPLTRLPSFARYAQGTAKHGCGWLDNDTGDIFEYHSTLNNWRPVVNIGFFRSPLAGTPGDERLRGPDKVHGRDLRSLPHTQDVQAVEEREDVLQIRNHALQHPYLRKVPAPKFVVTITQNWYLNNDGALPGVSNNTVKVLAEGRRGPVLLTLDNSVLLAAEVEAHGRANGTSLHTIRRIMKNFTRCCVEMLNANSREINTSLFMLLFGPTGEGGGQLATFAPVVMAPPVAISCVASSLGKGPTRVAAPAIIDITPAPTLAARPPPAFPDDVDHEALTSPRAHYTTGKKVRLAARHPQTARQKRMDLFLTSVGHAELQSVSKSISQAEQQRGRERGLYNLAGAGADADAGAVGFGVGDGVPELALGRLQLGVEEERPRTVDPPNSSRHLFGENLAYLDGKKVVGFEEQEAALLLGRAGGMKYRPQTAATGRRLTAPLDPELLRPEKTERPKSAGPVQSGSPKGTRPKISFDRPRVPSEDGGGSVEARSTAIGGKPAVAVSWLEAMAKISLYDVRVQAPPRLGARERPRTSSVGQREAYSQLSSAMREEHLPTRHPMPPRARVIDAPPAKSPSKKQRQGGSSGDPKANTKDQVANRHGLAAALSAGGSLATSSLDSDGRPIPFVPQKQPIQKVVVIPGQDASKFHNTFRKFERMGDVDVTVNEAGEYVGQYTEVYRSQLEHDIHEYNESKKSFVAGAFKTHFGKASVIPLRKEGGIRPHGSYPKSAPLGVQNVAAYDWNMLVDEDASKRVGGQWRK